MNHSTVLENYYLDFIKEQSWHKQAFSQPLMDGIMIDSEFLSFLATQFPINEPNQIKRRWLAALLFSIYILSVKDAKPNKSLNKEAYPLKQGALFDTLEERKARAINLFERMYLECELTVPHIYENQSSEWIAPSRPALIDQIPKGQLSAVIESLALHLLLPASHLLLEARKLWQALDIPFNLLTDNHKQEIMTQLASQFGVKEKKVQQRLNELQFF